jgi:hypothetical protein
MNIFSLSLPKLYMMFFIVLACFALVTFLPLGNTGHIPLNNSWYDPLPISIIFLSSYLLSCALSAYMERVIHVRNFFKPTLLKALMTTIIIPLCAFFVVNNTFLGDWLYSFLFGTPSTKTPPLTSYILLTDIAVCMLFIGYGTAQFIEFNIAQLGKKKPVL